jgi:hypothetical protein
MRMKRAVFIIVNVLIFQLTNAYALPTAGITVKAVDEEGVPVAGARVSLAFTIPKPDDIGAADLFVKGVTDNNGQFSAENASIGMLGFSVDHEGYYQSSVGYEFTTHSKPHNRWEPWNPTVEVVLKKIRNPVPMYVKYIEAADIPAVDAVVGYDLEKGDWVAPYGSGAINDLLFLCQNKYENFRNAETSCEISFSNTEDGFQEYRFSKNDQSYYKWPFEAPMDGYAIKKLNKWMSVHLPEEGYRSNFKDGTNYIFRVRTETDSDGNIIKANYGKIKGDIRVYKKRQVNFFYYFNPDGTRNLEEDPKRNLLTMK